MVGDLRGQLGDGLQHVVLDAVHTMPADNPDLLATSVREFIAEGRARAKAHVFPRA